VVAKFGLLTASSPTGAVWCCSYKEGEFGWLITSTTAKKAPKQDGFFLCSKRRRKQKQFFYNSKKKGNETHYPKKEPGGDTKPGVIEKAQTHVTLS
jgi:hypothetical protein